MLKETEPNDNLADASQNVATGPVRIEGTISTGDLDVFVVDLPAGPNDWSLFVYDSCSITTCSIGTQIEVTVHFEDESSVLVSLCQVWFLRFQDKV